MSRTMQGKEVDMDKLMAQNELMPAVGNAKVNARGDELGAGGKIVRKREDVVAAYYEDNPNAMPKKSVVADTQPVADNTEIFGNVAPSTPVKSKLTPTKD